MKVRLFGCGKFAWLASESHDRLLSSRERSFMDRHRAVCGECERAEWSGAMALNMLRESSMEPVFGAGFEDRVLRRHRVQTVRASLGYWSPAFLGASIAMVAILAGLQMVTRSAELPVVPAPGVEVRRQDADGPKFPDLRPIFPTLRRMQ